MENIINLVAPPGWGKTYTLRNFIKECHPELKVDIICYNSTYPDKLENSLNKNYDLLIIEECSNDYLNVFIDALEKASNNGCNYQVIIFSSQEPLICKSKFSQVKYKPIDIRFDIQGRLYIIDFKSQIEFNKGVVYH